MEINLRDLSTGFDTSNNNNLVKILENKIMIYQKENQALKNKIRILQDDNDDKSLKIQEQLNHLSNLENDNNSLKMLYDNSKKKFNDETMIFYSTKQEQDKELNNMKLIIEELKMENEKLSQNIILQNKENANLQKNLNKILSENKLYSQDNTILLSKVKEYEDKLLMQNNNSNNNLNQNNGYKIDLTNNNNNPNNTEFIKSTNNMYENKMALYSSIINDEINLIAKYIDTYFNLNNYISDANINIPQLQSISNFPRDNKLSSFANIINSVENALKRICMQNKFNKSNEYVLKQEINKLNNVLEKKNNENIELKKDMSDLKRKYFYLKNDFDKLNNDLSSQKGFNKQIQNTMNDISNGNDDYLKGLYQSIKSELDKILNDPLFHSYLNVIIEQRNNFNSNTHNTYMSNGMKYLFEDTLDKYILVNNCILDDYKKQRSDSNCGICGNDIGGNSSNVRELESAIDDLNNKLIQKDKIISNNKDEKKLLINQINILQRDILNLRNKNLVSPQKFDNKLLSYNYAEKFGNNINNDLSNKYSSVPIFPRKDLYLTGNNNLNNNIKGINDIIYTQPYIENNNKYLNDVNNLNLNYNIQNSGDKNNIINQKYNNNNNMNTNFDYNNDNINNMNINNNYNNNNINNMDNNIEELKDNENEEEEEENEIYYEGQPFPHHKGNSSDINMNDKNIGNIQNENNMNNFGNNNYEQQYNDYSNNEENENDNDNYNDEDQMYNNYNNNQFQEIIEEEENKNNTLEGDSNNNMSSKKNSNINSHKNSNINSDLNYNINNNQNMNNNNLKNINVNNNYNNSDEEYVNDEQANDEVVNQEQPQVQSNKSENNQGMDNEGNNN